MTNSVHKSEWGNGRKELLNNVTGAILLESSDLPENLFFIKGTTSVGGRRGEYVTKAELEELLDVTIIENSELPEVKRSSIADYNFHVGGYAFSSSTSGDAPEKLLEIGLRYIAASKEIKRRRAENESERLAKVKAEEEAAFARNREINALADVLLRDGSFPNRWLATTAAKGLYDAGVRTTEVEK